MAWQLGVKIPRSQSAHSMSLRRSSINDIKLPPNLVKKLSIETLKDVSKQDEATFFQWFEGLELEEVGLP